MKFSLLMISIFFSLSAFANRIEDNYHTIRTEEDAVLEGKVSCVHFKDQERSIDAADVAYESKECYYRRDARTILEKTFLDVMNEMYVKQNIIIFPETSYNPAVTAQNFKLIHTILDHALEATLARLSETQSCKATSIVENWGMKVMNGNKGQRVSGILSRLPGAVRCN